MFSILVYSDIIRFIKELSRDIQRHSEGCVTPVCSEAWYIQNLGIFRILAYLEPWYIQKPGIFTTLVYSEPCHIQIRDIIRTRAKFSTFVYSVSQAYSQPCQTFAIKRFPKTIEILF